jgi:hypothetical protein
MPATEPTMHLQQYNERLELKVSAGPRAFSGITRSTFSHRNVTPWDISHARSPSKTTFGSDIYPIEA